MHPKIWEASGHVGGKPTAGIGFAAGMERFLIALESKGFNFENESPDIYFVCIEKEAIGTFLSPERFFPP